MGTYGLFQQTGPLPTVLGMGGVRWKVSPRFSLQADASTNLAQTLLGVARDQEGNGLNLELTAGLAYTF